MIAREAPAILHRVLMADDNPDHLFLARNALTRTGLYEIDAVSSGQEALDRLAGDGYAVLLLDYNMPGMDGFDVLARMKELGYELPVIMITGGGSERVAVEAMKAGAYDYVVKSEGYLEVLPAVIAKAIETSLLIQKNRELEQDRVRRLNALQTVCHIAQNLASSADLPTALDVVVHYLKANAGALYGSIMLADEMTDTLKVRATAGFSPDYTRYINEQAPVSLDPDSPMGCGPASVAVRTRQICFVENVLTDDRFRPWRRFARQEGYLSLVSVPLVPREKAIGVINLYFDTSRVPTEDEEQLLKAIADTTAIAIERILLRERLIEERVVMRALEETDRIKSEFISTVSHELRTPLTFIKGYVDLILAGHTGEMNETQAKFLEGVRRGSDRLISLVNDLLDIARLESGRFSIRLEPCDLTRVIRQAIDMLKVQADEKEILLTMEIEKTLPALSADKERILQVLNNLISNAVKYSPGDTKVSVAAEEYAQEVVVTISDQGIGISPEDQKRLFQKFYRVDSSSTREVGGTGLGLAICKHIVEMHQGRIWVESEPGKGSRFRFALPKSRVE
ncbi:MAG: response regulator [Armatimonadetes bacterium]|nr:response regulator [Armatimonadota bacterium]